MNSKRLLASLIQLSMWTGTLTALAQPVLTSQPRTQFQWENRRVALLVTATGTSPLAYQWIFNGSDLADATNRTLAISRVQRTNEGNYQVVVRDATGSSTSEVARVMVRAWPRPTGPTIPELARLDTNMQTVMQANAIPGASLAIVKDGRLVFARGYGFAEVETNERYQPDSLWRTDSLAKTITAATYMQLVEEGKANLDAPVLDLLQLEPPSYPGAAFDPRWTNVTARLALLHAGGWDPEGAKDPLGATGFDPVFWPNQIAKDLGINRPVQRRDLLRWMLGKPMQFKPGTSSKYSNFGYEVVGDLIERLSGAAYEVRCQRLLARAHITRMQLGHLKRADRVPGEVVYYFHPSMTPTWLRSTAEPVPFDFEAPYASLPPQDDYFPLGAASGGWLTSAIDYARLVAALDRDPVYTDILADNTLADMAAPSQWPNDNSSLAPFRSLAWQGVDSATGIWVRSGGGVASCSFAAKYRKGVILVYNATTAALDGSDNGTTVNALWGPISSTLDAIRQWPTQNLFPATLSYAAWRASHFSEGELANSTLSSDDADPDGDGIPNLLEYASGTDPRALSPVPRLSARAHRLGDQTQWLLTYPRLLLAHEADYSVEASDDLQSWTAFAGEADEPALNPDGTVTAQIRVDPGTAPIANARFFRLRVTRKPQ